LGSGGAGLGWRSKYLLREDQPSGSRTSRLYSSPWQPHGEGRTRYSGTVGFPFDEAQDRERRTFLRSKTMRKTVRRSAQQAGQIPAAGGPAHWCALRASAARAGLRPRPSVASRAAWKLRWWSARLTQQVLAARGPAHWCALRASAARAGLRPRPSVASRTAWKLRWWWARVAMQILAARGPADRSALGAISATARLKFRPSVASRAAW
jgi:hypothetical protein